MKLAIIGSAGRSSHEVDQFDNQVFQAMVDYVEQFVKDQKVEWKDVHLISGGAAWVDHVAITLFLVHQKEGTQLTLYLPCAFASVKKGFVDNGSSDWKINPGKSANKYHLTFQSKTKIASFQEIVDAQDKGATLDTSAPGFHQRNTLIANTPHLLAFTWHDDDEAPKPKSGTMNTWSKCKGTKCHIPLSTLKVLKRKSMD